MSNEQQPSSEQLPPQAFDNGVSQQPQAVPDTPMLSLSPLPAKTGRKRKLVAIATVLLVLIGLVVIWGLSEQQKNLEHAKSVLSQAQQSQDSSSVAKSIIEKAKIYIQHNRGVNPVSLEDFSKYSDTSLEEYKDSIGYTQISQPTSKVTIFVCDGSRVAVQYYTYSNRTVNTIASDGSSGSLPGCSILY
jgi:uncharacterized membrane protein YvbJ